MQLQTRMNNGRTECFDVIRRKWVALTPEETVRQFLVHSLLEVRRVPASHISLERKITVNGLTKRYDLVVFGDDAAPLLVIECKAPDVALTQSVVEQVGRYNKTLRAPFIGVSNGKESIFFRIDFETEKITLVEGWPI